MRTEAEIKAKLDELRATQKAALDKGMVWMLTDMRYQIEALEWVLATRDEL